MEVLSCCLPLSMEAMNETTPHLFLKCFPGQRKTAFGKRCNCSGCYCTSGRAPHYLLEKASSVVYPHQPHQSACCLDTTRLCEKRCWITFYLFPSMSLLHPEENSSQYSLSCNSSKTTKQMQKGSPTDWYPGKHMPCQGLCKTRCDFVQETGFSSFGRMSLFSRKYISITPPPPPLFMSTGKKKKWCICNKFVYISSNKKPKKSSKSILKFHSANKILLFLKK